MMVPIITFSGGLTPMQVKLDGVAVGTITPALTGAFGNTKRRRGKYVLFLRGVRWTSAGKATRSGGRMAKFFDRVTDAMMAAEDALRTVEG